MTNSTCNSKTRQVRKKSALDSVNDYIRVISVDETDEHLITVPTNQANKSISIAQMKDGSASEEDITSGDPYKEKPIIDYIGQF